MKYRIYDAYCGDVLVNSVEVRKDTADLIEKLSRSNELGVFLMGDISEFYGLGVLPTVLVRAYEL